jgi:hypothetical protein
VLNVCLEGKNGCRAKTRLSASRLSLQRFSRRYDPQSAFDGRKMARLAWDISRAETDLRHAEHELKRVADPFANFTPQESA